MRRSRHKLQVSTFPFLAVLLGAMGALILLLLVMDRRSKIVARARAIEAHSIEVAVRKDEQARARAEARARADSNRQQDEAARQLEWERQRDNLHKLLLAQERELARQRDNLAANLGSLDQKLEKQQRDTKDLEKSLLEQRARLDAKGQLLAQMREGIARSKRLDAATQLEVDKLSRELGQLERALAEAQALKAQETETYSLVPYRGKLGENRRPIYVECNASGLVFHPDGLHLDRDFDIRVFRDEVERRGIELVREKRETERRPPIQKAKTSPYVLFLVRPDGLESYYAANTALRGFDLDFGYELIDSKWVLDFSNAVVVADQKATLPTVPQKKMLPPPPFWTGDQGNSAKASGSFGPGGGAGAGAWSGTSNASAPPSFPPSWNGDYARFARSPGGPSIGPATGAGVPSARSGLIGTGPGQGAGSGAGADTASGPGGAPASAPPGPGPSGSPGGMAGPIAKAIATSGPGGSGTGGGGTVGGARSTSPGSPGGLNPQGGPSLSQGAAGGGVAGPANFSSGSPNRFTPSGTAVQSGAGNPGATGSAASSASGPDNANGAATAQAGQSGGSGEPQEVTWRGSAPPGTKGTATSTGQEGVPAKTASRQTAATGLGNSSGDEDAGMMDPLARLTPAMPLLDPRPGPKKSVPAPTIGRLLANRDYVLTIECFKDVVALYPGGQVFAVGQGDQKETDDKIVRAVQQLISRRQATVRPGETPYRPMLRFQVHPDALRTYFHVYPLFENMRIPMTRENLDS